MGIPPGCCRIHGVILPIQYRDRCRKVATPIVSKTGDKHRAAYAVLIEWLAATRGG